MTSDKPATDAVIIGGGFSGTMIAAELARDRTRIMALRRSLRSRMAASPLCDGARVTRELERAYRAMWRLWTEGDGSVEC